MKEAKILNAGESGIIVEFGNQISPLINAKVNRLNDLIKTSAWAGVIETIPTYRSLLVIFEPLTISKAELKIKIELLLPNLENVEQGKNSRIVTIPVCYEQEMAPDMEFVCKHTGLTSCEVIKMHTEPEYLVYMIGFMAGFPYLGGMNEKLATPRLSQPRTQIPAGAVGIADKQTGIYPVVSPGGWQLIGCTPVTIYNPSSEQPFLFAAGDFLKFKSIDSGEYRDILQAVKMGEYSPEYKIIGGGSHD